MTIECENGHSDGWIIEENIVIDNDSNYGSTEEVECECNHYGCQDRKMLIFDIVNVKEKTGPKK